MKKVAFSRRALFLVLLIAFALATAVLAHGRNTKGTDPKLVDAKGYTSRLNANDMEVQSSVKLSVDGDTNSDGLINSGETLLFSFNIINKGSQSARAVKLDTGIPSDTMAYIDNVTGVTGISYEGDTVVFDNLLVQPNASLNLSFTSKTLQSPDGYMLDFTPKLVNPDGSELLVADPRQVAIEKSTSIGTSQITVQKGGDE